jgi:adenylate kinase family enzyme
VRQDADVRRVSVVGSSGSGKSRLAQRIAVALDVPHVELDAINHRAGWQALDRDELIGRVDELTTGDGWVVDGNDRECVVEGPVWARADTVVWLDLPRQVVLRQIVGRTVRRVVTREELWNGNREPVGNLWRWDPNRSVIRWAWTQHPKYVERYVAAMAAPAYEHLDFVRLGSHAEAAAWLSGLGPRRGG